MKTGGAYEFQVIAGIFLICGSVYTHQVSVHTRMTMNNLFNF